VLLFEFLHNIINAKRTESDDVADSILESWKLTFRAGVPRDYQHFLHRQQAAQGRIQVDGPPPPRLQEPIRRTISMWTNAAAFVRRIS
jgi:hypothetical protein